MLLNGLIRNTSGYLLDSKLVFNIHVEQKLENAKKTLSKSHT